MIRDLKSEALTLLNSAQGTQFVDKALDVVSKLITEKDHWQKQASDTVSSNNDYLLRARKAEEMFVRIKAILDKLVEIIKEGHGLTIEMLLELTALVAEIEKDMADIKA